MKFSVLVLIATISCCGAPYPGQRRGQRRGYGLGQLQYPGYYRNNFFRRPTRPPVTTPANPGTTPDPMNLSQRDNEDAANYGVLIPSDECIISWDDFQRYIKDRQWIGLHYVDDDAPLNPGSAFKFSARWQVRSDTRILREGALWESQLERCLAVSGEFERNSGDPRAIFGSVGGNFFATSTRRDYFVASGERPIKWFAFYICYDTSEIQNNRCRKTELIVMYEDQRPKPPNSDGIKEEVIRLNDIDWLDVENTLKKCFKQEFVDDSDPQIIWAWKNPSCAIPGTDTFNANV